MSGVDGASSGAASVFETGSGDFVVFDGYLFDRTELGTRSSDSDAALVAGAYQRWGEALFDKLRGAFALGIWDSERRMLCVGRDAMGLNPCFYCWDGRVFLMSSSLDALLAQAEVDRTIDRVVMAEFLQNTLTTHQIHETFYEKVRRLPAAHALRLKGGRVEVRRYWDPVPPGFAWASAEEAEQFPSVLGRAVGRCLVAGADCLALSGGLDSIGLAVLAAEQSLGKRPLHAVSMRHTNPPRDEGPVQVAVARALGMPLMQRTAEETLGDQSLVSGAFALSAASNCPVLSIWQAKYAGLLRDAADLGLEGLMMGTGGDEMLAVDLHYATDCLAAGDVRGLWRFYQACRRTFPFAGRHVIRTVLWHGALWPATKRLVASALRRLSPEGEQWIRQVRRRRAALRPWLSRADTALAATLQARFCHPVPTPLAPGESSYVGAIRRLPQMPLLQLQMEQGTMLMRNLGFALFLPYFDRDVVELLLRVRPEDLIHGGYHKAPLRRLIASRLPAIETRVKKVSYGWNADLELRTHGRAMWREFGGPTALDRLGLVRSDLVNAYMDEYFAGRREDGLQAWLFLSAEMWLRERSGRFQV
jgi:asparagine synthetase B (glutamine-hydrolysing)